MAQRFFSCDISLDDEVQSTSQSPLASDTWIYQAESLSHSVGRADGIGWSAAVGQDGSGYMAYGPYVTTIPKGSKIAQFKMMVDNNTADDAAVVTIDVNDATSNKILASKVITRKNFANTWTWQTFSLSFKNAADKALEFRVYWYGRVHVAIDKVTVRQVAAPPLFPAEIQLFADRRFQAGVNADQELLASGRQAIARCFLDQCAAHRVRLQYTAAFPRQSVDPATKVHCRNRHKNP